MSGVGAVSAVHLSRACEYSFRIYIYTFTLSFSDENVDVIYVSPRPLKGYVAHYYARLLEFQGPSRSSAISNRRFTIVTPEALDYFPVSCSCFPACRFYVESVESEPF